MSCFRKQLWNHKSKDHKEKVTEPLPKKLDTCLALYIDKWVPLVLALGVQGLKKIKIIKKETNYVPNQPKAVLMEYEAVLYCFFFEPPVQLPVLLF